MKVSDLLKELKNKAGVRFVKHGGEHDFYYCPLTGITTQIPRHSSKELPPGTANRIRKDAGLK